MSRRSSAPGARLRAVARVAVAALALPLVPAVAQAASTPVSAVSSDARSGGVVPDGVSGGTSQDAAPPPAPEPDTGLLTDPGAAAVTGEDEVPSSGSLLPAPPTGFYEPPAGLGDGENGEIIKVRDQGSALDAHTWMVMYHSTNGTGQDIPVTGRVLVPHRAWTGEGPRPIVTVGPGTRGVGDDCAPSRWLDYERPLIVPLLLKGYAVVVTDYEGLGTPGGHTYMVGQSQGRVVLDMVRAATNLPEAGLEPGGKVAIIGYSQGGGSAAWAGELWGSYAPELDVVGIAAGGVPADLTAVSEQLNGGIGFGFMLLAAFGYDAAYPELDLDGYLNDRGRAMYAEQQDACVDMALAFALQDIDVYTDEDPRYTDPWQARFTENRPGAHPPQAPVFLYHGLFDEIVAPGQAVALRDTYCAAGAEVHWQWHAGEHITTMVTAAPGVVAFVDRRFRERAFHPTC